MSNNINIEQAIDIFEHSFNSNDNDEDIRTVSFKVKELKEICKFLHHIRNSQFYQDYK